MVRHGRKEKWRDSLEGTRKAQREMGFRAEWRLDFVMKDRSGKSVITGH